jgi:hypothetical protein
MSSQKRFNRVSPCLITNTKEPRPGEMVIMAKGGVLVIERNGLPVPWPDGMKLIFKDKKIYPALMKHWNGLTPP